VTTAPPDDLLEVHILQMPVPLWARSQEQHDALMREFALMSVPAEDGERHLPTRLAELIKQLNTQFAGAATEQEEALMSAAEAGVPTIDLVYRLPAAAAPASRMLGEMLDEADDYCRQGQHLLTLAADDELVRFRWWFLDQMIDQAAGKPPVAWPDYRRG
jgi:hypothetical protein